MYRQLKGRERLSERQAENEQHVPDEDGNILRNKGMIGERWGGYTSSQLKTPHRQLSTKPSSSISRSDR